VVGQTLEPAVTAIQAAGFRALVTTAEGAVGVPGTVIAQSPASGNLGAGASITIVIIPAPPPPPTTDTTITPP
jgi:beta-lactam-binding protein with PASTA domain